MMLSHVGCRSLQFGTCTPGAHGLAHLVLALARFVYQHLHSWVYCIRPVLVVSVLCCPLPVVRGYNRLLHCVVGEKWPVK